MFTRLRLFLIILFIAFEILSTHGLNAAPAIPLNSINVEELFSKKHLDTDYDPIKLEASLTEPIDLTIADVIAKAIENNLNLKIAKQDSRSARWKFWQRFGDLLPDFSLRAAKQKLDGNFYINSNFAAPVDETVSTAGLRLNYRAFNGGASTFLALSEKYFRESVNEQERSQYNQTLYDSVNYYIKLLQSQAALTAKIKALERAKINLDLADKFLKAGNGTKYDLMQADANLAQAQQELISQEAEFRFTQIDLSQHLNSELNSPYLVNKDTISEISIIDNALTIEDFIQKAFEVNPNIQAALKRKKGIARQSLSSASAFLPTLDLYVDVSGAGADWSDMVRVTSLGLEAQYNIGEGLGFNAVAKALESKAQFKKAELEYLREIQSIKKALRMAYLNYQKAKALVHASEKEYIAAQEALRLSQLRYKNGLEIFANLSQRELDLTNAHLNLINAKSDYNLNQVRLLYDMGTINAEEIVASNI